MAPPHGRKKSMGRRKIEMKFIEDENARTVAFSKRRAGLFKKASELSILCGAQITLVIFSLCGRAYSFGHPSVDSVINRFCNRDPVPKPQDSVLGARVRAAMLQELRDKCDQKNEELEARKKRARQLKAELSGSSYTPEKIESMEVDQLTQLKAKMEKLRGYARREAIAISRVNVAEPSNAMNVANPAITPSTMNVAKPPTAMNVAKPPNAMNVAKPPIAMNVAKPASTSNQMNVRPAVPAVPGEVNLGKMKMNRRGASPIPSDWLKL